MCEDAREGLTGKGGREMGKGGEEGLIVSARGDTSCWPGGRKNVNGFKLASFRLHSDAWLECSVCKHVCTLRLYYSIMTVFS